MEIRQVGPCFAGEVSGIDLTQPLSAGEIGAIHAGMDEAAVLVFHDQRFTDDQQLVSAAVSGVGRGHRHQVYARRTNIDCRRRSRMCPISIKTISPSPTTIAAGFSPLAIGSGIRTVRLR